MEENDDFTQKLSDAVAAKSGDFDSRSLPAAAESFRMLLVCAKNLRELFVKRGLVKDDPYKADKKISDVKIPDTEQFPETETATVMGIRLADFESMLDYVCSYFNFSVDGMSAKRVKKLLDLSGYINWMNLAANSPDANTRAVASLVAQARVNAPQMTQRLIIDALNGGKKAQAAIGAVLKELSLFLRQKYKLDARQKAMRSPSFDEAKAAESEAAEIAEIKRAFPSAMGKTPVYNDLVSEIAKEDHAANKDALRAEVLQSLQIKAERKTERKKKADPKDTLIDAVAVTAATAGQLSQAVQKIQANGAALAAARKGGFEKFKAALRRAFKLPEPKEEYNIIIADKKTQTQSAKKIERGAFCAELERRARIYAALSNRQSPQFAKISSMGGDSLLAFATRQLSEMQGTMAALEGLDAFFKASAAKGKIKGMKMEIETMRNSVIKARQRCAEYASYIEEENQMKKLGITNDE